MNSARSCLMFDWEWFLQCFSHEKHDRWKLEVLKQDKLCVKAQLAQTRTHFRAGGSTDPVIHKSGLRKGGLWQQLSFPSVCLQPLLFAAFRNLRVIRYWV